MPAIIAVPANDVRAHGHAIALLELLPVVLDQAPVGGIDFHHGAHVLVAVHGGIDDFLLGFGAAVEDLLALIGVLVGAANARHLHLEDQGPAFELGIGKLLDFDFTGGRHDHGLHLFWHVGVLELSRLIEVILKAPRSF